MEFASTLVSITGDFFPIGWCPAFNWQAQRSSSSHEVPMLSSYRKQGSKSGDHPGNNNRFWQYTKTAMSVILLWSQVSWSVVGMTAQCRYGTWSRVAVMEFCVGTQTESTAWTLMRKWLCQAPEIRLSRLVCDGNVSCCIKYWVVCMCVNCRHCQRSCYTMHTTMHTVKSSFMKYHGLEAMHTAYAKSRIQAHMSQTTVVHMTPCTSALNTAR